MARRARPLLQQFGNAWTTAEQRAMAGGHGIFGAFAGAYDALRPDYPLSMWTAIFTRAQDRLSAATRQEGKTEMHSQQGLVVADVGAGTGRGALRAAEEEMVREVFAIEPDQAMLDQCAASFASASTPAAVRGKKATFLRAPAEHLPLPDSSIDLALCLQAWHWVDNTKGLAEIVRVLRPGGIFAVAWNDRDLSVPWVIEFEDLIERYNPHYERHERQCDKYGQPLSSHPQLRLLSQENHPHGLALDSPQRLVDLTHTFSYVRNALTDDRLKEFSAECLALAQRAAALPSNPLLSTYQHQPDPQASSGPPFVLPLQTRLYLLQRAADN
eukprot:m.20446 g.20446  ORF g.20446 m.20446 type:complete len:328 (+) comp8889_c0_seq1:197-1180(+)